MILLYLKKDKEKTSQSCSILLENFWLVLLYNLHSQPLPNKGVKVQGHGLKC